MKYKRLPLWATVSVALAAMTACDSPQAQQTASAASPALVPAAAAAPRPTTVTGFVASGPLVVENQLDVQALREGVIQEIRADVGTRVNKGELLAQLDDRQITAERDAAAAKVKSIAADVQSWTYDSQALKSDFDRAEAMYKANLTTKEALDHARAKYEEDSFEIERDKQNMLNAQETVKSLNFELEKTRIVAPFAGVVARRYVQAGQKVSVGDRLFWVTATAPLRMRFTLPERFAGHISNGQRLPISVAGLNTPQQSRVVSVSPVVDPASGTIEVVTQLVDPGKELRPGLSATIHLSEPR